MEKATAPHSSTLAWRIPWTEEPGRLQSMGSLRVGHDWTTSLSLFTFMRWRRKWKPSPVFLPGESRDSRAWWAAVYGVAHSQTRLKWLSSSSSSMESEYTLTKSVIYFCLPFWFLWIFSCELFSCVISLFKYIFTSASPLLCSYCMI